MSDFDVAVIGGGPGGYTAALECARSGARVLLIERELTGGTCLNVGCIPSKALIQAANTLHSLHSVTLSDIGIAVSEPTLALGTTVRWKDGLVEQLRRGVEALLSDGAISVARGEAQLVDGRTLQFRENGELRTATAEAVVVATGSVPVALPQAPFGGKVISSTEALSLTDLPERLLVVGGGYIGLELGTAFRKLGSQVTIVEAERQVLPLFDAALVRPVERRLKELGVHVLTSARATKLADDGLHLQGRDGSPLVVDADAILVTVGRRPVIEHLGLERAGVDVNEGAIAIDDQCRTSCPTVYAIGDATGEPMLAHRAIAQAHLVSSVIRGEESRWDHRSVPAVCFTDPEIFQIGASPEEAAGAVIGRAQFRANGRALTRCETGGFLRVVVDPRTSAVVGIQAVGPEVSELASAASTAIELGATIGDLTATIVAHPTLSETLTDACLDATRRLET